jgi:nicotinic acid mononucleotide adenylyltransferase
MEFLRRSGGPVTRLGILSAAFHPPTRAHLALARSALDFVSEVVFVMPRRFPHKEYEDVGLDDRLDMVLAATADEPRFSVGVTDGGLFIDIARECREACGAETDLWFLCGRDAAERIVSWDYGAPGAFAEQLEEFGLLVADRNGPYEPPPQFAERIRRLRLDGDYGDVSSTHVREQVRLGGQWEELVPPAIRDRVRELYSG